MAEPILRLENVSKTFRRSGGAQVHAVRNVSLHVDAGETVALVGESGSGKSTLGRIALGLVRPDAGRVLLEGRAILDMPDEQFRAARTVMQPIFQDAGASLNPRRPVHELLAQATRRRDVSLTEAAIAVLESVGLRPGADYLQRHAHELSGGQRQRVAVARALAMEPKLLIADEPLSGADVSIRGQILNLLIDIKQARGVAYLMITHDISIARAFADRVAVMMQGEIVETGRAQTVLGAPQHPYTQQLVAAVPTIDVPAPA
jgi:ABC-type glutathione transport system ATPase component